MSVSPNVLIGDFITDMNNASSTSATLAPLYLHVKLKVLVSVKKEYTIVGYPFPWLQPNIPLFSVGLVTLPRGRNPSWIPAHATADGAINPLMLAFRLDERSML